MGGWVGAGARTGARWWVVGVEVFEEELVVENYVFDAVFGGDGGVDVICESG